MWDEMKRRAMDSVSTLEMLQMDGETNEVQGLLVESYPSLFLFKALDKSTPVAYKGSFVGAEDIVEWALEHMSVKFRRELLLLKGNDQKDDLNIVDSVSDAGAVARDEL